MDAKPDNLDPAPRNPLNVRFFYGWVVAALTFVATLMAAGIRAAPQTFVRPLEAEFGWSRASIMSAVSINLVLYGAIGPVGGRIQDRRGVRVVMLAALALLCVGVGLTAYIDGLWEFVLVWGFIVGTGAGGLSSVLAASVAHRWFVRHRGVMLGLLNSAGSTGQLIFIPLVMGIIVAWGWRAAATFLACAAAVIFVLVWWLMRNDPADVGDEALGESEAASSKAFAGGGPRPVTSTTVRDALRHRTFWLLCGAYAICGGTSNGLIGSHMIPHALDIGISTGAASWTVAIMGGMNFVGTMMAGWLSDRMDPRKVLAWVYGLRAVSLFILPAVTGPAGLFVFGVIYGLDWFATVPPVVALAGSTFGKNSVGSIYGLIFMSHQLGGAAMAQGGGVIFDYFGDYVPAFLIGAVLAVMAAAMSLAIAREAPRTPLPTPQPGLAAT